jgi:hypothetical protein
MAQPTSPTILTLDSHALDALVARVTEAKEHLSADDTQLLLDALMTQAGLQERLNDKDITLHKLRKLLGMVHSSEKLSDLLGQTQGKGNGEDKDNDTQSNRKNPPEPTKNRRCPNQLNRRFGTIHTRVSREVRTARNAAPANCTNTVRRVCCASPATRPLHPCITWPNVCAAIPVVCFLPQNCPQR